MITQPSFRYAATVIRVVDGDTVDLHVDLGMRTYILDRFRLYGINAPERSQAVIGKAATQHLIDLLSVGDSVLIDTHKDSKEKYGRWLATIYIPGKAGSINEQMVLDGHAVFKDY